MKKQYVLVIAVVAVLVAGGAAWYVAAHKNTNNNTAGDMSSMNMKSSASTAGGSSVATNSVAIQNFAFSPASITVKVGTKVTWTNKDSVAHTVTETDSLSGPDSGNVNPGASYSFTFTKPGTYHYRCTIHPEMVGTVTVSG